MSILSAACLAAELLLFPAAFARDWPTPDEINYDKVPGMGANGGTEILEWVAKSSANREEPLVAASLEMPAGLSIRWLGVAGWEISDGETSILVDPFITRPSYIDTLLFKKLPIDTEAIDKYVFNPMGPGGMSRVKVVLVSHTHHDHALDVPYVVGKYPRAADRPLVVGDRNVRDLLAKYDGRVQQNPWLAGVDDLSKTPQKIFEFDKCDMEDPPDDGDVGYPVGTFGDFKITAFVNYHGLYDVFWNVQLEGPMEGEPPFFATNYKTHLNESMNFLIEYQGKFNFFVTDSPRNLNGERVAFELRRSGGIDVLLQGIASRLRDNHLDDRVAWFAPRYIVPSHYDNFFFSIDRMRDWAYEIPFPNDNSRLKEFLNSCGTEIKPPCPPIRMTKFGYYYSMENLIRR